MAGCKETEGGFMEYKYHCQRQAESFARSILPVPEDYPLREGLPEEFRRHFRKLSELARCVYGDMALRPEAYGLMLLDITEADHNLARDSYRSVHRFVDTLNAMFLNGEAAGHILTVDSAMFKKAINKNPAVPKYGLILARLIDFGFAVSDFNGDSIDKNAVSFTVEYPGYPDIIGTLKTYCERWAELDRFRRNRDLPPNELIKHSSQEFHHHFYRFDYKITADLARIPMLTWVNEEADYLGYDENLKRFNEAFYLESLKYGKLKYDGEYHYKGKRIARVTAAGYSALGAPKYILSIKLKNMDKYIDEVKSLPEGIRAQFEKSSCANCGFQGATSEYCKFRLKWTLDGASYTGCAFWCFAFDDFDTARVPLYWRLAALEYGFGT
jgi:hypothetical protein